MAPTLITDVLQHLSKTIADTSAQALTCTDVDKCRIEFRQESDEYGKQITVLYMRDKLGNNIYRLNVELTNNVQDHEERANKHE